MHANTISGREMASKINRKEHVDGNISYASNSTRVERPVETWKSEWTSFKFGERGM